MKKYFEKIPIKQKNWLQENFEKINNYLLHGLSKDFYEYDRLLENVLGKNKRLFNCDYEVSFIESICNDYLTDRKQKFCIEFFLERMNLLIKEAAYYEFFEVAYNLKFIHDLIKENIDIIKTETIN